MNLAAKLMMNQSELEIQQLTGLLINCFFSIIGIININVLIKDKFLKDLIKTGHLIFNYIFKNVLKFSFRRWDCFKIYQC